MLMALVGAALASSVSITWQARIADVAGDAISEPTRLQVDLSRQDGTVFWSDTFTVAPNDGLVSLELGSGDVPLSATAFGESSVYVQAFAGGQELGERTRLWHVPLALRTEGVRVAGARAEGPCTDQQGAVVYDTDLGGLRVCDGTQWQLVRMRMAPAAQPVYSKLALNVQSVRIYDDGEPSRAWGTLNPEFIVAPEQESGTSAWHFLDASGDMVHTRYYRDNNYGYNLYPRASTADDDRTYMVMGNPGSPESLYVLATSHDGSTVQWTYRVPTNGSIPYHACADVDDRYVYVWFGPNGSQQSFLKIDKTTGSHVVRTQLSSGSHGYVNTCDVRDGQFVAQTERAVTQLDDDGQALWTFTADNVSFEYFGGAVAVRDRVVLVGGERGTNEAILVELDAADGSLISARRYSFGSSTPSLNEDNGNSGQRVAVTADGRMLTMLSNANQPVLFEVDLNTFDANSYVAAVSGGGNALQYKGIALDGHGGLVMLSRYRIPGQGIDGLGVLITDSAEPDNGPFNLASASLPWQPVVVSSGVNAVIMSEQTDVVATPDVSVITQANPPVSRTSW